MNSGPELKAPTVQRAESRIGEFDFRLRSDDAHREFSTRFTRLSPEHDRVATILEDAVDVFESGTRQPLELIGQRAEVVGGHAVLGGCSLAVADAGLPSLEFVSAPLLSTKEWLWAENVLRVDEYGAASESVTSQPG